MTIVEALGPLSGLALLGSRARCPCGQIIVLRSSWTSRWLRVLMRRRIHLLSAHQLGRARVMASSVTAQLTEAMLSRWSVDPQMEQLLLRFFAHDEHILFVCRKNLFQWIQDELSCYYSALDRVREEGCRSAVFVPADPYALRLLRCWKEAEQVRLATAIEIVEHQLLLGLGRIANVIRSRLTGIGLLATVAVRVARQGVVWRRPARRSFRVAMHNHHGLSMRPHNMRFADCLADGQRIRKQDLLVLLSGTKQDLQQQRRSSDHGVAETPLFGPPVPVPYLAALLPRMFQAASAFWRVRGLPHAMLRRRAAGAIRYGCFLEVLLHHYAFDVLLSKEESFSHHIVETVVLNRWGARTAWIPHSVASRDYNMSYLHYDVLPIPGRFPETLHGKTWSRRMMVKPVGVLWNDGVRPTDMVSASELVRTIIADARRDGRKIITAFTGGYATPDEFLRERNERFLTILASLAERESRVQILIKPKASIEIPRACAFLFQEPFRTILEPWMSRGIIQILDPSGGFACTAQDLIAASDVVISTSQYAAFNSVWVEALLLGKPSYSFTPVEFRRALSVPGLFDEWLFDNEEALLGKLRGALHGSLGRLPVDDRMKALFDPYNDGRAFERFRETIATLADGNSSVSIGDTRECAGAGMGVSNRGPMSSCDNF